MPMRQYALKDNYVYHIFNRGVAKQAIFGDEADYSRFIEILDYYRFVDQPIALSTHRRNQSSQSLQTFGKQPQGFVNEKSRHIEIIAFCLMPNHFHLMLRQLHEHGISTFVGNVTNSYTRGYNTKYDRVGPLFQGPFKSVWLETDEQLIHVSRYIHLNSVVANLCKLPEDYPWSSFRAYLNENDPFRRFCDPKIVLDFFDNPATYQRFTDDHIDYARSLEIIKHAILD
jgi:putative transposase